MSKDPSKHDEISSTEKLLEAIRGKPTASQAGTAGQREIDAPGDLRRQRHVISKLIPARKQIVVGIDFGPDEIRLVKAAVGSDRKAELLGLRSITFRSQDTANFSEFLRAAVLDFAGSSRKYSLWALVSSARAEIRHLRIPKVGKKQIFNAVYWTMKKEVDFDDKSAFDFTVQGEVMEGGVAKLLTLAYIVPAEEVQKVKDIFSKSGLPLSGITLNCFGTQNLFKAGWMPGSNEPVACLHIEDESSRIYVFSDGNLVSTRAIKTGINSMAESLAESAGTVRDTSTASGIRPSEMGAPQDGAANLDHARNLLAGSTSDSGDRLTEGRLDEEEVFQAISPAAERLARQIEITLSHYSKTAGATRVGKIYISGVLQNLERLCKYIGEQLGIKSEVLDPLSREASFQSGVLLPASVRGRVAYFSALGLALSNTQTPNLLFTYSEKQESEKFGLINQGIAAASILIIVILAGVYVWQGRIIDTRKHELGNLQQQLAQYTTPVDQNMIVQAAAKAKSNLQSLKGLSRDFLPMAVLSELSALTPENVRLIDITMDLGGASAEQAQGAAAGPAAKEAKKTLIVDGIVTGDSLVFEATLARYLMGLGFSPIFVNPSVYSSKIEFYRDEGQVLRFMLTIGLV